MTAFDYTRSKATADRLIARYGMAAVLRRPTSSGPKHNPQAGTPNDVPVRIVVLDFSTYEVTESGGRVQQQDKKILMARGGLSTDPTPSDKLVIAGQEHAIIGPDQGRGIRTVAPGGTVVLYELQARR